MDEFNNVPQELRAYRQWVVWRYEERSGTKPTKVPYNPLTGHKASVTNSATWCDFDEVCHIVRTTEHYNGIGFVFSDDDPFAFVDLDDTEGDDEKLSIQKKIVESFDTYSERSPSGNGLHVVVKGMVRGGRRRGSVELYSNERYMTVTGSIYQNKPIEQRQNLVDTLWEELGGSNGNVTVESKPQTIDDRALWDMASTAANGAKFINLWNGNWKGEYSSQSQADMALINIIAFYTDNTDQVTRMFRQSGLGQRDKAKRTKYVNDMVNKSFDQKVPLVDFTETIAAYDAAVFDRVMVEEPKQKYIVEFPPGLLGDIAQFIYDASIYPVRKVAILGAIGIMAGVCGRAYNVSGTGLNQYLLLLAPTGIGKESLGSGVDKMFDSIKTLVPAASEFRGPATIASGPALTKRLAQSPCFVSVVGEFGLTMKKLAHPRANAADLTLKQNLLNIYNKSGSGQTLQSTQYADKEKTTKAVSSPAVTLLGESTPETLYSALDESLIADGLLPRFFVLEHDPADEKDICHENHMNVVPNDDLVQLFATLTDGCLRMMHAESVIDVVQDEPATKYLRELRQSLRKVTLSAEREATKNLWNRVHLKTLKLAATVAVGINANQPVITLDIAQWSYALVYSNVDTMVDRFDKGEVGEENLEKKQYDDAMSCLKRLIQSPFKQVSTYGQTPEMHRDKIIPYGTLQQLCTSRAAFRKDRIGGGAALKRTINVLMDAGILQPLDAKTLRDKYNTRAKAMYISDFNAILDHKN